MFLNYLKIAFRSLLKNKAFTAINIFGLSVGLTCCMLITLYIYHETSYDKHLPQAENLYQVGTTFVDHEGKEEKGLTASAPLGQMLQQEYPEVIASTRMLPLFRDDKTLFQRREGSAGVNSIYEQKGVLADPNFFSLVPHHFLEGNPATALSSPNSVVLNEDLARKLFGSEKALDKIIRVSSNTNGDSGFRVTGVFAQPSSPSNFEANFFLSFAGGAMDQLANDSPSLLYNNMFNTLVRLQPGADAKALEQKLPSFVQRHLGTELQKMGTRRSYFLEPVTAIHLAGLQRGPGNAGSKTSLYILGCVALLTLLIACINFMNLATANSAKRATEVGIRKVLGAERGSLRWRFLGESLLMASLAFVVAAGLTWLLLPLFQNVSGKMLLIPVKELLLLTVFFLGLSLATGLVAGSYPAMYLSSFRPIKVLKGRFANSLAAVSLRKGLVVFQFVVSVALIIASVVIADQMRYMRNKDLGFAKDQQIVLPLRTAVAKSNANAFKTEAATLPGISSIGGAAAYPGVFHPQDWLMYAEGASSADSKRVIINIVDDQYLKTLGVNLVAGRLFSPQYTTDTFMHFVINEAAVKQFGFASSQQALNKYLAFDWQGVPRRFTIVGVVKDFHFKDLHEQIEPLAFRMNNDEAFNYLVAKASGANLSTALSALQVTWKKINPNEPFEYSFLDQDFQKNYEAEERRAKLINAFTAIAIIISCLGLFGLATFTAEQRTKEIGIRKVLGASVGGVVALLSKDFLKLVCLAVLIASPLAWWAMNKWLQSFAYKTAIGWTVFALTAILAILIAFATISVQAVKAALANPVKNLRTE